MDAGNGERSQSNRRNAEKSTGPQDTSRTRHNAVKHGLVAEGITSLDDPSLFAKLCRRLRREFKPNGTVEAFLVERIALAQIRIKRSARLEAEMITSHLNPPTFGESRLEEDFSALLVDARRRLIDPGLPAMLS